jgi:hypothetical protein
VRLSPAGGLTVVGAFVVESESKKEVLDGLGGKATETRSLPHNNQKNPRQSDLTDRSSGKFLLACSCCLHRTNMDSSFPKLKLIPLPTVPPLSSAIVPPPSAPRDSFCQLVYKFFEDFVCPSSRRQETQWFDVDTIEVARGIKTTRQPVFSDDLEATEAANARLVTEPYIARDKNNVPILGYFPGVLHGPTVHKTHIALSAYIGELSAERATWAEKRAKKNDEKEAEKDAAGITT